MVSQKKCGPGLPYDRDRAIHSGPHFFCETIARHLCKEPITSLMSDVPNYEIREKLEKVIFLRTQLYNILLFQL